MTPTLLAAAITLMLAAPGNTPGNNPGSNTGATAQTNGKPAAAAPAPAGATPLSSLPLFVTRDWDTYKLVASRNIFERYHQADRPPRQHNDESVFVRPPETPPPDPASFWVLTGIVLQSADRIAFLENTSTGVSLQVHDGQTIDAGKIAHVGLNFVELDYKGGSRQVVIGSQLDGSQPGSSVTSSTPAGPSMFNTTPGSSTQPPAAGGSASTGGTSSSPPPSGPSSMSETERRMRERHARENGK